MIPTIKDAKTKSAEYTIVLSVTKRPFVLFSYKYIIHIILVNVLHHIFYKKSKKLIYCNWRHGLKAKAMNLVGHCQSP